MVQLVIKQVFIELINRSREGEALKIDLNEKILNEGTGGWEMKDEPALTLTVEKELDTETGCDNCVLYGLGVNCLGVHCISGGFIVKEVEK